MEKQPEKFREDVREGDLVKITFPHGGVYVGHFNWYKEIKETNISDQIIMSSHFPAGPWGFQKINYEAIENYEILRRAKIKN